MTPSSVHSVASVERGGTPPCRLAPGVFGDEAWMRPPHYVSPEPHRRIYRANPPQNDFLGPVWTLGLPKRLKSSIGSLRCQNGAWGHISKPCEVARVLQESRHSARCTWAGRIWRTESATVRIWPARCIRIGHTRIEGMDARTACVRRTPLGDWTPPPEPDHVITKQLKRLLVRAWKRCIEDNLPCDIDILALQRMWSDQGGRCAVSGLPFSHSPLFRLGSRTNPWGMSLDQIEAGRGYIQKNLRLVLWAVNLGLCDWGEDIYLRICRAVAAKHPDATAPTRIEP